MAATRLKACYKHQGVEALLPSCCHSAKQGDHLCEASRAMHRRTVKLQVHAVLVVQRLEALPHAFIAAVVITRERQVPVTGHHMRSAVSAFNSLVIGI